MTGFTVDVRGDVWMACAGLRGSTIRHFIFKGCSPTGALLYGASEGDGYVDEKFPDEGGKVNAWGMCCRLDYDADRDIMINYYPAVARKGEADRSAAQYLIARYDNWSKGNRVARWKIKAPHPLSDPDFFMYETKLFPYSGYMGLQLTGDYVFFAYLFGEIHVFDANTGKMVRILALGPEVDGGSAWEDAAMGLRAFRRQNGEYLIFTENSGWGGKDNFFRWNPEQ